jgi:hypothetical protein
MEVHKTVRPRTRTADGTLVFYANLVPPGILYRDIADGHWIAPDTIALTSILGPWFNQVKSVRVRSGVLTFGDGSEWRPLGTQSILGPHMPDGPRRGWGMMGWSHTAVVN